MDQTLVAAIRKKLETKSTEKLRQDYERSDHAAKSPEELEAIRQILDERKSNSTRVVLAWGSAIAFGLLGAAGVWWQGADEVFILLTGVVCAILGFGSWYIPGLVPHWY